MIGKTNIEIVDTKTISKDLLFEISKIQKDMWAFGLWEYLKCNCCGEIYSKNDIFWHLSCEIRKESVTKLEEIYLWDNLDCKKCNSANTEFIYDISKNIEIFINRYKEQAFLVLSYDEIWDVVWFCDWYISDFSTIFLNEFLYHYHKFDSIQIENKIMEKLDLQELNKILCFSSLWTYEKYVNYNYIYDLLRSFFRSINFDLEIPWITELDKNNSLYKIYQMMGSISLWLDKNIVWNVSQNYNSDICVFPNPISDFKNKYDVSFRSLVKNHKIK